MMVSDRRIDLRTWRYGIGGISDTGIGIGTTLVRTPLLTPVDHILIALNAGIESCLYNQPVSVVVQAGAVLHPDRQQELRAHLHTPSLAQRR